MKFHLGATLTLPGCLYHVSRIEREAMKREMEAYLVLLHLVSQGWAIFGDIRYLVGWDVWKHGQAIDIMSHIHQKILALSETWDEDIPQINVFMFDRFGKCTSYVFEEVFGCEEGQQPSPLQIAEYAKRIATYENWDQVVEAFRKDAFSD